MVVEADGGSRGNPGPAGYGAVVLDAGARQVLGEVYDGLGTTTNNVAEYRGLIAGLRAALDLGATEVEARMDSKLVVEQMSGRWKIKHPPLQELADTARELAAEFDAVTFVWIPRKDNARADALANRAMDGESNPTLDPSGAVGPAPKPPAGATASTDSAAAAAAWTGQTGSPTRLILLRHGQTELSVERRYSGHGDPELTELGQKQAAAAARALETRLSGQGVEPAVVLSSPLRRARQTAAAVAETTGADLEVRDGLIETDFGGWEGLTFTEARERDPELHGRWLGSADVEPPGGESFRAVGERVEAERARIVEEFAGRTVVLVSHVTPIKMLLRTALGAGDEVLYRMHLDLACLNIADFYPDGGASVRLVNETSYLDDLR
ncbi:bifunctional RNase H/acid phosphatase [Pseudonocardia sp. DR1-2]|uniref:bifunctional RNase H/acid phosphatase n=1 Tax=Pseudonocardia sp. DR1-2 TaxID=2951168 RepID=UPI0020432694|nr:bifunctional RNase H/acid phosphatase [Pseudonocardia sp. DR1-2]MCM3848756.1 bifunctional RNase H/acid phosphatase [Pseudonocardia sp. DR1-2]